jgi:hypothetical protein
VVLVEYVGVGLLQAGEVIKANNHMVQYVDIHHLGCFTDPFGKINVLLLADISKVSDTGKVLGIIFTK